jgi:thioredoxin 1
MRWREKKMSKIINKEEFEKLVLNSEETILVDFYADWCGPCKMLSPIMDEISNDVTVYKVNTDDEEELSRQFGIMSIPTLLIFENGEVIHKHVGVTDKETLMSELK